MKKIRKLRKRNTYLYSNVLLYAGEWAGGGCC